MDWKSFNKPRRVEPDLLSYFREVETLLDNPVEDVDETLLIQNIYDEMKHNEASLASDKRGSEVLEKIVKKSTSFQLRTLLNGFCDYHAFLATNRYSSHVLQLVLRLLGPMVEQECEGSHFIDKNGDEDNNNDGEKGEDDAPLLQELIPTMCQELQVCRKP